MSVRTAELLLSGMLSKIPITPGKKYCHYKSSDKHYQVISLGLEEATEEPVVIYRALYGEQLVWTRKVSVWLETVNGVPRFTQID